MYKTMIQMFETIFMRYKNDMALRWHTNKDEYASLTYGELGTLVDELGVGLLTLGVKPGDHIGLIEDVSKEWCLSSMAIQMSACVDVPRGTDSTGKEVAFILSHSDTEITFVSNQEQIKKIEQNKGSHTIKYYILLDNSATNSSTSNIINVNTLIEKGRELIAIDSSEYKDLLDRRKKIQPSDLSTIIYTSGTTGEPKGVQLTQANFAYQINTLTTYIPMGMQTEHEVALTLLPPWHIFGRVAELFLLSAGASITYTDIKNIGDDMKRLKPTIIPAVPRIWEGVYNKILGNVRKDGKEGIFNFFKNVAISNYKAKALLKNKTAYYVKPNILTYMLKWNYSLLLVLFTAPLKALGNKLVFGKVLAATGGSLKYSISGGGALPKHIDEFLAAIGVNILEGYGLTETAPLISIRTPNNIQLRTVGAPSPGTEIKLLDLEGNDVTKVPDAKGTLHIKGPQVMRGYYKNAKKTEEAFVDGWFNTGDLLKITTQGLLSIVGRSKDTIVLLGGENVEPSPIEEKLKESVYIDHIMCVGQDQKTLGALIVPNEEMLSAFAKENNIPGHSIKDWSTSDKVIQVYKNEINNLITVHNGFKSFEKVTLFRLLDKPFEKGDELNNTLKVVRHVVYNKYNNLITEMYK